MKRILVLKNGLEAASILVSIMTAPGVDRRIVSEDCIDACIALTRQHLSKNIIPCRWPHWPYHGSVCYRADSQEAKEVAEKE